MLSAFLVFLALALRVAVAVFAFMMVRWFCKSQMDVKRQWVGVLFALLVAAAFVLCY